MPFDTGPRLVMRTGSGLSFYEEYTTTNLYAERVFGGKIHSIAVTNDSTTDTVSLSWNGTTLIADIKAAETLELPTGAHTSIYVRGAAGGDKIRIWAT